MLLIHLTFLLSVITGYFILSKKQCMTSVLYLSNNMILLNQHRKMGPNICFNQMQGNKLCGVISNSALIFYCAVRLDTKLTEGGSNKPMTCSASHKFVSRGLHVPIAPALEALCYNYAYKMHSS